MRMMRMMRMMMMMRMMRMMIMMIIMIMMILIMAQKMSAYSPYLGRLDDSRSLLLRLRRGLRGSRRLRAVHGSLVKDRCNLRACEKKRISPVSSRFPMLVPSLSW
jgi:hypothetical protein